MKKTALLSLLAIVGIIFCGISFLFKPLLIIGGVFALIGGINLGKLIRQNL